MTRPHADYPPRPAHGHVRTGVASLSILTFLHDCCIQCSRAIEVIAPSWDHFMLTFEGTRGEWRHAPDDHALCVTCAVLAAPVRDRAQVERRLQAIQERKTLIGLPDTATLYYVRALSGDVQFDQFLVRTTGTLPTKSPIPRLLLTPDDPEEATVGVLFLAWDFATADRKVTAHYTWHAADLSHEGLMWIDGWSRAPAGIVATLVKVSRRFIEEQRRGRPLGPVYGIAEYESRFQDFLRDHRRPPKSQEEFIAAFPEFTRSTVKRFFEGRDEKWAEFKKRLTRELDQTA